MNRIFLITLTIAVLVSCSRESDTIEMNDNNHIEFSSSIQTSTRNIANDSQKFSDNEKISVIGYRGDLTGSTTDFSNPFMDKLEFTYSDEKFTSTSDNAYWQRGKTHNFYAYYPSDLSINPLTTAAPTAVLNVNSNTGINIDVMHAKAETGVYYAKIKTATLAFTHRLSKIQFKIVKEANAPMAKLSKIEFTMSKSKGEFNLATGVITNSGEHVTLATSTELSQIINPNPVQTVNGEWIVLPGDTINNIRVNINNVSIAVKELSGTVTKQGEITTIIITVKAAGIEITSSIEPWSTDNKEGTIGRLPAPAKIGDYYYTDQTYSTEYDHSKTLLGIVFRVKAEGSMGMIVSLDQKTLEYATTDEETESNDIKRGKNNHNKILTYINNSKETRSWANFPAFKWCNDKNIAGVTGWYFPSLCEQQALYAGYSGLRWVPAGTVPSPGEVVQWDIDNKMLNDSLYYNNRFIFNRKIKTLGVDSAKVLSGNYSTSSETGIGTNYIMYFDLCSTYIGGKRTPRIVRCIKSF
ncbi:fimbrillin family protein [Bacteroides sp.]|uniref:fimbrillin family protein n=1 Tax=Bacteroides sp. TaxID=29523 RepID=UPI002FCAA2D0